MCRMLPQCSSFVTCLQLLILWRGERFEHAVMVRLALQRSTAVLFSTVVYLLLEAADCCLGSADDRAQQKLDLPGVIIVSGRLCASATGCMPETMIPQKQSLESTDANGIDVDCAHWT
jgi:hypothetical protein